MKAGKLIPPGQTLDEEENLADELKYPEEENIQVVDEVDPTDRKPTLFEDIKGTKTICTIYGHLQQCSELGF